ncbi:MAG TPA: hypothetical protein VE913_17090, partial [Longimicrobium sp.]|nr:hypothetical protein [Longimicrobium sp.]
MNSLLLNLLAAAGVSAIVSAAVSLWLRGPARGHSGSKNSSLNHASPRRPAQRRSWDDDLEDDWIEVQKRMLTVGRAIATGAIEELHAHRALSEARPAARVETPRPRLAQPPSAAPTVPTRERDDGSKADARDLYREWCTQGGRPEPFEGMRIVP